MLRAALLKDLSAAKWTTDVIVQNRSCDSRITVTFQLGPPEYNFRTYSIELNDGQQQERNVVGREITEL